MAGDARAKELIDLGDRLFTQREPLMSLMQEIAWNFYPERATFTTTEYLGREFCSHLMDSYPVMMRRELGNLVSAMLRPRDSRWFRTTTLDDELDYEPENARFLEYLDRQMRSALYDPRAKFVRATKEADHDFVAFGQGVISVEEAPSRLHLYLRSHHIRDCAWLENPIGDVDHLHRKDRMSARNMRTVFGEKALAEPVKQAMKKSPGQEFNVRCIVLPADEYDHTGEGAKSASGRKHPFSIVYVDADNGKILREGGLPDFLYVVPRWATISGSQYAFSPASVAALPEGRMAQDIARIVLESGEKAVDPPMVATEEAVREVNIRAGAITWVDREYDERLGEAVRPLKMGGDMSTGFAMRTDSREILTKAWYLDKLTLPPADNGRMTAYEVAQRLEEFRRQALPLFEPMEVEYNAKLLDKVFGALRNMNAFDFSIMPEALSDRNLSFHFESPIQQASSKLMVQQFRETLELVGAAKGAGASGGVFDLERGLRDAVRGVGGPSQWRRTDAETAELAAQQAAAMQAQQALLEAQQVAQTAQDAAGAASAIGEAMQPPQEAPAQAPRARLAPQPRRRSAAPARNRRRAA